MPSNRRGEGEQKRPNDSRKDAGHAFAATVPPQGLTGAKESDLQNRPTLQDEPQPVCRRGRDIGDEIDLWL